MKYQLFKIYYTQALVADLTVYSHVNLLSTKNVSSIESKEGKDYSGEEKNHNILLSNPALSIST